MTVRSGLLIFFIANLHLAAAAALPPKGATVEAVPAPAQPKLDAEWACKTFALDERGQAAGELNGQITVGTLFLMACEGPSVVLARDRLGLELPNEQKYALRLLAMRNLTDTRAEFIATAWTAGQVKLNNPILSDGAGRVGLGKIEFNVASVIDPKANPEGRAFGPWGAMVLPWPLWVWLLISAVFFVLFATAAVVVRRRLRRRRLLKLLEAHPITMSPYHHFNKQLRRLTRELPGGDDGLGETSARDFIEELDQSLRWFLARELIVPAFDRGPREIARGVRRIDEKLHDLIRKDLVVALGELRKARGQKRLAVADAQQLLDLARAVADKVSAAKEKEA